ncbi:branched-chain amino acid ABC transporter substrate-binding protein [Rubrivivax sp. A210]|uniref:branched-chain amino acid ABC transporter substrate-binding protein n=1 Tax=Rubrivivax sp. A210 TaxID=2772301 RepID=UPI001F3FBBFE|nr:branched-chain amino acid ABC transporter substrate-binding protein [Rubrivivax sp. A210]
MGRTSLYAQVGSLATGLALASGLAAAAPFKVTLLVMANDPRLERNRLERGYLGQRGGPLADALKIALAEGKPELESVGARIDLEITEVADAAGARAAAAKAEAAGTAALVADLPAPWLLAAADAVKAPVLNVGATDDALRQADCRRQLWHLLPSERMRADAVAQFLVARRWQQVLLLTGPADEDRARIATAQASIKRMGLKLVATRPFKLSADPRERDLANPALLTGPSVGAYDVVWVVDSDGEFATSLPYRTGLPRPVVGDAGLAALAWSPRFERYGAPQVTRRLTKAVGRPMGAHDWPAWMAGKALVAAAVAAPKGPGPAFAKALAEGELDGSKGVAMSFRPWDGQLRQPLLLSDGYSTAALAPIDGMLHPKNNLDTLGADAPEKLCKVRS